MNYKFISFLIPIWFLSSCGENKKAPPPTLVDKIKTAESKLDVTKPLNKSNLELLIGLYTKFADSLPNNPKSQMYLVKTADFYGALNMQQQKCELYKSILAKYPTSKDADMITYLLASAYDSDLNNRVEAKKYYNLFIEKFPNSPYINDAKSRLTTIDSLSFNQLQDMIIHNELQKSE